MTDLQQELIDKYHAGQMNEQEIVDFEHQLQSDPALKAESDLQSDIINGLKEYRKLELKSRLESINVGHGWLEFAHQSALIKSLGGVVVASLVGAGVYFVAEPPTSNDEQAIAISINTPTPPSTAYVLEIGELPEADETISRELTERTTKSEPENLKSKQVKKNISTSSAIVVEKRDGSNKIFRPNAQAPDIETVDDDGSFATSNLDKLPSSKESSTGNEPIDVRTENSSSHTIKYKYYDGKLFLKGDFDEAPYEILEINSSSARKIYIYYLDKYYKVSITDRLTELPEVMDAELVKELELLRENK